MDLDKLADAIGWWPALFVVSVLGALAALWALVKRLIDKAASAANPHSVNEITSLRSSVDKLTTGLSSLVSHLDTRFDDVDRRLVEQGAEMDKQRKNISVLFVDVGTVAKKVERIEGRHEAEVSMGTKGARR